MRNNDIIFLHAKNTPICPGRRGKRFTDYWAIQYSRSGAVELSCDGACSILEGSWLWVTYPGPEFVYRPAPGHRSWHHRYVAFKGPLVSEWSNDGLLPKEPIDLNDRPDLSDLFDETIALAVGTGRWSQRRAANLLERLLLEIADQRQQTREQPAWIAEVLRELEAMDYFQPNYEALARRMGMALSTLRRKFRLATGGTLHELLLNRRLSDARQLLLETDLPIKDIAAQLGYKDVYFFTRQFKASIGQPPRRFRESHQW